MPKTINNRKLEYDCNPIFPSRWSPRAMSGESISNDELMKMFEAARWAPSAYNSQPWRFLYGKKGTKEWDIFLELLALPNRAWCKNADVLIVVASKKIYDYNGKADNTHSLSTGAAWENLALQGSIMGLVVHGMAGFDYARAREVLEIPEEYDVEMMIAIGKPGKKEDLPIEIQKGEFPSDRKQLKEMVFNGKFRKNK